MLPARPSQRDLVITTSQHCWYHPVRLRLLLVTSPDGPTKVPLVHAYLHVQKADDPPWFPEECSRQFPIHPRGTGCTPVRMHSPWRAIDVVSTGGVGRVESWAERAETLGTIIGVWVEPAHRNDRVVLLRRHGITLPFEVCVHVLRPHCQFAAHRIGRTPGHRMSATSVPPSCPADTLTRR